MSSLTTASTNETLNCSSSSSAAASSLSSYEASHTLTKEEVAKFSRQLILQGFGPAAQQRLKDASVLVIGAGGLGCPISLYLSAAGVGRIGVVDHDAVSLDNLHRQIAHDESCVGEAKVESLKKALQRVNPATSVDCYGTLFTSANAMEIVRDYDVVADCSDNVATRYLTNDACVLSGKPLVSGSALGWEGQLTVYNNGPKCPCYRCIFPVPPSPETVTNCSDGGVLGPIVGIIGSLQALEVMKIIVRGESSFAGTLFLFDGLDGRTRKISLREKMPGCAVCGKEPTVRKLQDYVQFCGAGPIDKKPSLSILEPEERIGVSDYNKLRLNSHTPLVLIDTRPANEFAICHLPEAINVPLDEMKKLDVKSLSLRIQRKNPMKDGLNGPTHATKARESNSDEPNTIYIVCHRGNDSQLAVELLRSRLHSSMGMKNGAGNTHGDNNNKGAIMNLRFKDIIGGLDAWALEVDSSFPRY